MQSMMDLGGEKVAPCKLLSIRSITARRLNNTHRGGQYSYLVWNRTRICFQKQVRFQKKQVLF